ncbi:MAG: nitroreductase family protein, partial [Planctomycetota bacterium]
MGDHTIEALAEVIDSRRDVRRGFLPNPVSLELIERCLRAAHRAPSVGFMQPWKFISVEEPVDRETLASAFETANRSASEIYAGDRSERYRRLKLAALREAPHVICVTCDHRTERGHGLGRQSW